MSKELETGVHPCAGAQGAVPVVEEGVHGLAALPRAEIDPGGDHGPGIALEADLATAGKGGEVVETGEIGDPAGDQGDHLSQIEIKGQGLGDGLGEIEIQPEDTALHGKTQQIGIHARIDAKGAHHHGDELLGVVIGIEQSADGAVHGVVDLLDQGEEIAQGAVDHRQLGVHGRREDRVVGVGDKEGQLVQGLAHVVSGADHRGQQIVELEIAGQGEDGGQMIVTHGQIAGGVRGQGRVDGVDDGGAVGGGDPAQAGVDLDAAQRGASGTGGGGGDRCHGGGIAGGQGRKEKGAVIGGCRIMVAVIDGVAGNVHPHGAGQAGDIGQGDTNETEAGRDINGGGGQGDLGIEGNILDADPRQPGAGPPVEIDDHGEGGREMDREIGGTVHPADHEAGGVITQLDGDIMEAEEA